MKWYVETLNALLLTKKKKWQSEKATFCMIPNIRQDTLVKVKLWRQWKDQWLPAAVGTGMNQWSTEDI